MPQYLSPRVVLWHPCIVCGSMGHLPTVGSNTVLHIPRHHQGGIGSVVVSHWTLACTTPAWWCCFFSCLHWGWVGTIRTLLIHYWWVLIPWMIAQLLEEQHHCGIVGPLISPPFLCWTGFLYDKCYINVAGTYVLPGHGIASLMTDNIFRLLNLPFVHFSRTVKYSAFFKKCCTFMTNSWAGLGKKRKEHLCKLNISHANKYTMEKMCPFLKWRFEPSEPMETWETDWWRTQSI